MKCVNHPEHEATEQCVFCKDVLCDDCAYEIGNKVYACGKCYDKYILKKAQPVQAPITTEVENQSLCCWHCNKKLSPTEVYKTTEYGQCYCDQCYNKLFDPTAAEVKQPKSQPKKKDNTTAVFVVMVLVAIAIFYIGFNSSKQQGSRKPSYTTNSYKYETTTSSHSYKPSYSYTPSYSTTKSNEAEDPLKGIDYYAPDTYKVGIDIPSGEYMLVQYYTDASGYMCVSSDSNGNDIIDNALFKNFHYIKVSSGQYLKLTNAIAVSADKYSVPNVNTSCLKEGMYKVGVDIPAGEYKAMATSSSISGYYAIYNTASADRDIEDNELFTSSSYVTVINGQYLELSNCTASLVD